MKRNLIYLTTAIYTIVLSLVLVCIFQEELRFFTWVAFALIFVVIGLCLLNMHHALFTKNRNELFITRNTMIFKLILIPFHILSFIAVIMIFVTGLVSVLTIFWLVSIPIIFIACLIFLFMYIKVISTSVHNISLLFKLRNEENIVFLVIHSILHLIMVLDVIDSIYLYSYFKKKQSIA